MKILTFSLFNTEKSSAKSRGLCLQSVLFSATCDKLVDKWVKDHGQNSDKGIKAGAAPVSFNEVEKVDRREIYDPKV